MMLFFYLFESKKFKINEEIINFISYYTDPISIEKQKQTSDWLNFAVASMKDMKTKNIKTTLIQLSNKEQNHFITPLFFSFIQTFTETPSFIIKEALETFQDIFSQDIQLIHSLYFYVDHYINSIDPSAPKSEVQKLLESFNAFIEKFNLDKNEDVDLRLKNMIINNKNKGLL